MTSDENAAGLMPMTPVGSVRAALGEGPLWDDRRMCLWWLDIVLGKVHSFEPATGSVRTWSLGQTVSAIALTEGDTLLLAVKEGFAWFEPRTGELTPWVSVVHAAPDDRFNDGMVDPRGWFWAGTLSAARTPTAALYSLAPDGALIRVFDGVTVSNGIDWSPTDDFMYYVDTATRRIDRFSFDPKTGRATARMPWVSVREADGKPDGLIVDAVGDVWVAMWGGGCLHRYTPDGSLAERVAVPAKFPTKMTFGGKDLGTFT